MPPDNVLSETTRCAMVVIQPPAPAPYVGPFLIGTIISAIFFGILSLQSYLFLQGSHRMRRGPLSLWMVVLIWLLNALTLFSASWSSYRFMVTYFGSMELILGSIPWSVVSIIICAALSNGIVQAWFGWCIWLHYGRRPAVAALLGLGILCTGGFILTLGGKAAVVAEFQLLHSIDWILYLSTSCDFSMNLVITLAMAVHLSRTRRSPLYRWDYLITAPAVYMSHAGVFCLAEAFLVILIRILRPNDFIYFGVFIPYSTMYANALLGFLNSGAIPDDGATRREPKFAFRGLQAHAEHGTEHAIQTDMHRALGDGVDTPTSAEMPLAIHIETVVEKRKPGL